MSQTERLHSIISDGLPHRSDDLVKELYGVHEGVYLARLGARVWDAKRRFSCEIKSWPDKTHKGLWFYQMVKQYEPQAKKKARDIDALVAIAKRLPNHSMPTQGDLFYAA